MPACPWSCSSYYRVTSRSVRLGERGAPRGGGRRDGNGTGDRPGADRPDACLRRPAGVVAVHPDPFRAADGWPRAADLGARLRTQLVEVFGQRRLLRWTIPGLAHFFTFWGFVVLITVYIEAYGVLFDENFAIPLIGHSPVLGFLQDFIALAVLASIISMFAIMRIQQAPERRQRASRFYGSHTSGAWLILFMIFNVIWTLFLFRGTEVNNGTFPYRSGAFASDAAGALLAPLGAATNQVLETVGLMLHIGVMLAFLMIVLYSKHLHIFIAPINVAA